MPQTDITPDDAVALIDKVVRFYTDDGELEMTVKKIEFPYAEGTERTRLGVSSPEDLPWIRVDLRDVHRFEIHHFEHDTGLTVVAIGFVVYVVALGLYIMFGNAPLWGD
jgi:hypothetical protein